MSASARPDPAFWRGRRVLLTGHTGFKGSWAALWLAELGAHVHGFALPPETSPSLWQAFGESPLAHETLADLADADALREAIDRARPQIVLHMAAQAIVGRGFADPVRTIAVNTLGTAQLLGALRDVSGLEAVLVVTTDKVYAAEGRRRFVESDRLGGSDPYSASKAAAELVTAGLAASCFDAAGVPVATARAGNVIGGGDWGADRLVPDVWRAARAGRPAVLRASDSVRPWQHVLEPLGGYMVYLQALAQGAGPPRALNFGPDDGERPLSAGELATMVGAALDSAVPWEPDGRAHPLERGFLAIDSTLARETIGWVPRLDARGAAEWTAGWYRDHDRGQPARALCLEQIRRYGALT